MNGNYDMLLLQNQLCFPLYAAAREVTRRYKPFLDPLGLTYTGYVAMLVLWETPGLTVKQIGERLHLDSGTLTPLLKKLESQGLVQRTRSETDERSVTVAPTPAGFALREQAAAIPAKAGQCLPLTGEEAATLYGLLYKILEETNCPE